MYRPIQGIIIEVNGSQMSILIDRKSAPGEKYLRYFDEIRAGLAGKPLMVVPLERRAQREAPAMCEAPGRSSSKLLLRITSSNRN